MVLIKHEIPSGMEYRYVDHTISQRSNVLHAGTASTSQAEQPPASSEAHNGQAEADMALEKDVYSIPVERCLEYAKQMKLLAQRKLADFNSRTEPGDKEGDYQFQLELLELQGKISVLRARAANAPVPILNTQSATATAKDEQAPDGSWKSFSEFSTDAHFCNSGTLPIQTPGNQTLADYQMYLMLKEQQNKKRLRDEQARPCQTAPNNGGNHALQDYEMQLKLLEEQNRKRKLEAAGEPANIGQRADSPHESIEKNWKPYHAFSGAPSNTISGNYGMQQRIIAQQQLRQMAPHRNDDGTFEYRPVGPGPAAEYYNPQYTSMPPHVSVHAKEDYERGARKRPFVAQPEQDIMGHLAHMGITSSPQARQDYEAKLNSIQTSYPKGSLSERQAQEKVAPCLGIHPSPQAKEEYGWQLREDYANTLRQPEQANKEGLLTMRNEQDPTRGAPLIDYNLQLKLLEQQNKKRLMMMRQQQEMMAAPPVAFQVASPPDKPVHDYEAQLKLLEQSNKKRLFVMRQEQDGIASCRMESPPSYLPGSPGVSCSPTPSSAVFTPESSVASPPANGSNLFNEGRPLAFRTAPNTESQL